MPLSPLRRYFRLFLYIILSFSFLFAGTATYFFVRVKQDRAVLREITPTLFAIDVLHYQTRAMLTNDDGKHRVALKLYRNSFFSPIYAKAADAMMSDLAAAGHAPSQTVYADIILTKPTTARQKAQAMELYQLAAAQDFLPARQKLDLLENKNFIGRGDGSRPENKDR